MIFLDFEASAGMGGYPIEVGFCAVEGDKTLRSAAKLIRWDEWLDELQRWDWQAEQVHHISRENLMEMGESPRAVMRWLNDELAGMAAFADSPMDQLWLRELAEVAGITPAFRLGDIEEAFYGSEISPIAYEYACGVKDLVCPKAHRAARDAEHLANWYLLSVPHSCAVQRVYLDGSPKRRLLPGYRP